MVDFQTYRERLEAKVAEMEMSQGGADEMVHERTAMFFAMEAGVREEELQRRGEEVLAEAKVEGTVESVLVGVGVKTGKPFARMVLSSRLAFQEIWFASNCFTAAKQHLQDSVC